MPSGRTTPPRIYKQTGSDRWWFRFSHAGTRYRASTGESDEAKALEVAFDQWSRVTHETAEAVSPALAPPQTVFTLHSKDLEQAGRNSDTILNYARYAVRFAEHFGGQPLGSITQRDAEGWRDWLLRQKRRDRGHGAQALSPKLVSEHLNWLAAVYKHFGMRSPLVKVQRPTVSHADKALRLKYFTREEMRLLFVRCPAELRPTLTFLAYTGCRLGEMIGLRNDPRDIDQEKHLVWVTGKGSKRRQLQLDGPAAPAWDAIQEEIKRRGVEAGDPVFSSYRRWADKRLRALCADIGTAEKGPHALRHTFATFALMYWGWDTAFLAKWLGHDLLVTFRIYGHLVPKTPPKIEF